MQRRDVSGADDASEWLLESALPGVCTRSAGSSDWRGSNKRSRAQNILESAPRGRRIRWQQETDDGDTVHSNSGLDGESLARSPAVECSASSSTRVDRCIQFCVDASDCAICLDEDIDDCVQLPCGHGPYCAACLRRHAQARLDTGSYTVPCPECSEPLSQASLRVVLPHNLFDLFLERSLEKAVGSSDDLFPCPTPDCKNRVALEGDYAKFFCQLCQRNYCLRCQASPYHDGLTCDQFKARRMQDAAEQSIQNWMEQTGSKQCPKCQMGISKQDLQRQGGQRAECHKMICRNCGTRFCFHCLTVLGAARSCGCTGDNHGFIDPKSGGFVPHWSSSRSAASS